MNPNAPYKFLVIDHNPESGELLTRSLHRKFPSAVVTQATELEVGAKGLISPKLDAVVLHRMFGADSAEVVTKIRERNAKVAIVVVSGIDRSEAALAAGANGFLNFDQWLLVGTVVSNAMAAAARAAGLLF